MGAEGACRTLKTTHIPTYLPNKLDSITSQQFPSQSPMWEPQIPQHCIHPTKCHWPFITKAWGISKHSDDSTARVSCQIMLRLDGFTNNGKLVCPLFCNMLMWNMKFSRRQKEAGTLVDEKRIFPKARVAQNWYTHLCTAMSLLLWL
jgi:hypothetical protein